MSRFPHSYAVWPSPNCLAFYDARSSQPQASLTLLFGSARFASMTGAELIVIVKARTAISFADLAAAFIVRRWPTLGLFFQTIAGRVSKAVTIPGCGTGSRLPLHHHLLLHQIFQQLLRR